MALQNLIEIDIKPLYSMEINSTSFAEKIVELLKKANIEILAWYSCADECILLLPESARLKTPVDAPEASRYYTAKFLEILEKNGIEYDAENMEYRRIPEDIVVIRIFDGYGCDEIVARLPK